MSAHRCGISRPCMHQVRTKKKNAKVYVEYVNLLSDEDGHKPLRELKDGWWTGVVTRLLNSFRYTVTFQNLPDELEFGLSNLRFHRQWLNRKWVQPRKQVVV
nr:DUF724 domain-containing protein 6-like isoform X2 [Ipomoea batatas]